MIISQTPVRISFFGGGTDFPEFFRHSPGAVLSASIDRYVYLTVNYLSDFFDYRIKVSYSKTELVHRVEEIEHPAVRACLAHLGIDSNIEINYFSHLPARTGLGTSSSFVVGLLHALYGYLGRRVPPLRLAEEAVRLEREVIAENVGFQDQYAAACGGMNFISFQGAGEVRLEKVIAPPGVLKRLQESLLLFYTGIQRYSDAIQEKHVARIADNRPALTHLAELAVRGRDLLSGPAPDLDEFGRLLDENWRLKKNMGTGVSNPEIDELYGRALENGALGGKLLGAGGGGFLLFFVPVPRRAAVRQALNNLLEVGFSFENSGSRIIFYDPDKLGNPGEGSR
jgi:D-glycero-alpha-D-manno-heptose-7-phosphate kinase